MVKRSVAQITVGETVLTMESKRLMRIRVNLPAEGEAANATITVDSTGLAMPSRGDEVTIDLGWDGQGLARVFKGRIDDVTDNLSRSAGQTFEITARGTDTLGEVKTTRRRHWDNATVGAIAADLASMSGLTSNVAPDLAGVSVPYFAAIDESVFQAGTRLASQVGGHFRIEGDEMLIASKTANYAAVAAATYGKNLIEYSISTIRARNRFGVIVGQYFDRGSSSIKTVEVETELNSTARYTIQPPAASKEDAQMRAEAMAATCARDSSSGTVTIDGGVVICDGRIVVSGTKSDGEYRVVGVTHEWSRSGWTTNVSIGLASQDGGGESADN
ncbi:phage late control D family protein [Marivivens aquimaris]|uniref:phage late control D family protein n=1 Tax=Marivivens aquimaris TaxID=2774876 RepID=UPI0018812047|nr:contractile injection system protein, VgrG/Pvc8 family [Marivivens aquimaris]